MNLSSLEQRYTIVYNNGSVGGYEKIEAVREAKKNGAIKVVHPNGSIVWENKNWMAVKLNELQSKGITYVESVEQFEELAEKAQDEFLVELWYAKEADNKFRVFED